MTRILNAYLLLFFAPFFYSVFILVSLIARLLAFRSKKPRLVWGSTPIINNAFWSRAMCELGFASETFTNQFYSRINKRNDWGRILQDEYRYCPHPLRKLIAFADSLLRYDVFFISADGFFIGHTVLWRIQAFLLKIAGKKTVLIPYGGDAYCYRRIRSNGTAHGLMMSYPVAARNQKKVASRLDYWCRHADVVIPGVMAPDGFGRWDVLAPTSLCLDLSEWSVSGKKSNADGTNGSVFIAHAPNHRGFKGSEFLMDAVATLKDEGLKVELLLLENKPNAEVREILQHSTDILVEQLICTGHGMNAVEGFASGIPVVSNLDDDDCTTMFRRWSFLNECPIASASPESIVNVLRKLVTRPALRSQLGIAGRQYAEKYLGLDSAQYLFGEVIEFLYGRRDSLINLYHPLLGDYPKRKPIVEHPLVNNRIVD